MCMTKLDDIINFDESKYYKILIYLLIFLVSLDLTIIIINIFFTK